MIFVTGGTGFLGAHLLLELVKNNEVVFAGKRTTSCLDNIKSLFAYYSVNPEKDFEKIKWIDIDLENYYEVEYAFEHIQTVYHCAAIISFHKKDYTKMIDSNIAITKNCVDAALAKGIGYFCHVSSVSALGNTPNGSPINESSHYLPGDRISAYGYSKLQSEMLVWEAMEHGLNASIINPSVILGAWDINQGSAALFKQAKSGLKYYTAGGTGYVDVKDVVAIMLRLKEKQIIGNRYLLNSENLSYKEFFKDVADSIGEESPTKEAGKGLLKIALAGDSILSALGIKKKSLSREIIDAAQRTTSYSNEKVKTELGFDFKPISQTISEMADYLIKK